MSLYHNRTLMVQLCVVASVSSIVFVCFSLPLSPSGVRAHLLADLADPHHRRESAPVLAMHSAQKKRPIKRTKTDKMPSRVGEGKTIQVPRTVTCPDFVLRERQQIFTVTDVKMTEMTVDRHCE